MIRSVLAPLAALALTSCFIQPGAFESALTLNRDGTFDYNYSGEVVALSAAMLDGPLGDRVESAADAGFDAEDAVCSGEGDDRFVAVRGPSDHDVITDDDMMADPGGDMTTLPPTPCTAEEIERERAARRDLNRFKAVENKQKLAMLRRLGGLGDGSEEAYREVARRLNEQRGWSGVTYQGNGVFTGSYRIAGRVDAGFVFPLLPTTETITPFVRLVPLTGGRVRVDAPGLTSAADPLGPIGELSGLMKAETGINPVAGLPQPHGTFTLTTDAEVRTNNTVDGPSPAGRARRYRWTIGGLDQTIPEALLRL